ncbi:MAG: hypothetical protein WAP03_19260 [Methylorubrum rhodinum]|uniref:hypothetical protein n=1 Tax=Methylorubrum rhodinum TaxID=29428 RepID=UPI003BB0856C
MPFKNGHLTKQEVSFAKAYARYGDERISATLAGYAHDTKGYEVVKRPEVVARIQHEVSTFLKTEGVALGVRVLAEIADGEKYPAAARAMAAKEIVKLGGGGVTADGDDRPLHMLTAAELHAKALKAQAWLDELERNTIDHEPLQEGGFFD